MGVHNPLPASVLIVVGLAVATCLTAGTAIAGFAAIMAASAGVASSTMAVTILSFATVGAGMGLAGTAIVAALSSSNTNDFADYGDEALIATAIGGGYGAIGGYCSYKQQMTQANKTFRTTSSKYWKSEAANTNSPFYRNERALQGNAPSGYQLNHPYGRYGSKIDMFYPTTISQHTSFHQYFGYGNGNGGFNQYFSFDNVWDIIRSAIR